MINVGFSARVRQRNSDVTTPCFYEPLDVNITGVGQVFEVLAQHRICHAEPVA